jgi:hypothetical protein
MVHHHRLSTLVITVAFSSGDLCGCVGDQVDLGESTNPSTPSGSLCAASTTLSGRATAGNQQELNDLAGCEVITGDLFIYPFEDPDFTPLSALRRVQGTLEIGRLPFLDDNDFSQEIVDQTFALRDAGWISSLAGFENLSAVGNLILEGVSAPTLAPLRNLSALTDGGALQIGPCVNLEDLTGLENLTGIVDLPLSCGSLVSLRGLTFPRRMRDVFLETPALGDLGNFGVEELRTLRVSGTQLVNLDALSELTVADALEIGENPLLTSMDGLGNLQRAGSLMVFFNDSLDHLPEFETLYELGALDLVANLALTRIPSFPGLRRLFDEQVQTFADQPDPDPWPNMAPTDLARFTPEFLRIASSPLIEEVTIPYGWIGARDIEIGALDGLRRLTFTSMRSAEFLAISLNAVLESVDLGDMRRVTDLVVADNAVLPLDVFDDLETFERLVTSGPAVPEEPAP